MEIWCECFSKNRADITPMDSNRIRAILIKLGWERHPIKQRIPIYGPQWVYVPPTVPLTVPPPGSTNSWNSTVPEAQSVEHAGLELAQP